MRAIIAARLKREASVAMIMKKRSKKDLLKAVFGCFFVIIGMVGMLAGVFLSNNEVYAVPIEESVREDVVDENLEEVVIQDNNEAGINSDDVDVELDEQNRQSDVSNRKNCKKSLGAVSWLVCPVIEKIADAVDWLYEKIEDILIINPISTDDTSPVYLIWQYCLGVTNVIFIIFLLVVIYSQLTGLGISNYGIKRALPKLIVAAVLINLSFFICSLGIELSNIIGNGLRGVFTIAEESAMATGATSEAKITFAGTFGAFAAGTTLAVGAGWVALEFGVIWMLIPVILGAIASVVIGLITIALRQAVVILLIMISPLAIVANILPNTEQWFKKWKDLLVRMLVFYPVFSLLFGASSLAGFALIMSAKNGFGILLGLAVQVFPLFFSWKLMQMSGTVLGSINSWMRGVTAKPLAASRVWADSHRQATRAKTLAHGRTPSAKLMQFMSNRKVAREEELSEHATIIKNRGLAYNVSRKYKNGVPTREAEREYAAQAKNMEYERIIERHKNNMNKGLGQLEAVSSNASRAKKARLEKLDIANVEAADMLFVEKARGEKIEYDNAMGRHKRFEDAINAHSDAEHKYIRNEETGELVLNTKYKMHDIDDRDAAEARYKAIDKIMEGEIVDVHYAAANAAQAYDTQKKIIETKYQTYFDLTPPTKDVMYRIKELSRHAVRTGDGTFKVKAVDNIDAIISGLRVVNQRGDTDLVKSVLDDLTSERYGGVQLGTHASQALASFLMFEVKDNDPFLRRFGKYINLETARVYNNNERKAMDVTYDEYIKGYHVEPDGEIMYAKKGMRQLVEGTSLDNIERTALSNLDDSLKKAYGFDEEHPEHEWDVEGYLKKREEVQTSFEPAFLSASLKWLSGSEQINSGVKFWTGYDLKQKKERVVVDGREIERQAVDENGEPIYELTPVWKGREFQGHEDEVERYYRRKTGDYFKDQTTGQFLGMRTDYRDATREHMVGMYLGGLLDEDDMSVEERDKYRRRRAEYDHQRAEIQTRYGNLDPETANKKRNEDLKNLDMDIFGRQVRDILGKTGKLEQIHRLRRSGATGNTKDWVRKLVNLDDERALESEVRYYRDLRDRDRGGNDRDIDGNPMRSDEHYWEGFRARLGGFVNDNGNLSDDEFYEESVEFLEEEFGSLSDIVGRYRDWRRNNTNGDKNEMINKIRELLGISE